jgi:hypothetical protein
MIPVPAVGDLHLVGGGELLPGHRSITSQPSQPP